jgi:hypothetical protein
MKCSGARDTRKGIKPCGRLVKPDMFDAFCSDAHKQDALTFAGQDAYNRHVSHFRAVAQSGDKDMFKAYNDTARPMFVSMLEAQKVKLKEHYVSTVCAEYAHGVRNAWSGVGSNTDDTSVNVMADLQEVQERRASYTKRKSYEGIANLLFGGASPRMLLTDGQSPSPTKKSRENSYTCGLNLLGYSVTEPEEVAPIDPTKVPLPDDDDTDLMSE